MTSELEMDQSHEPEEAPAPAPTRKRWMPEASDETSAALRRLALTPWIVAERDALLLAAIRRNLGAIEDACSRLGWVLVVQRDFVRLRKSAPVRRAAWAADGPTPLQASWFFLLVAGAESVAPKCRLSDLVTAARAAAGEAGVPSTHDIVERRAIVTALRMLDERGVVVQLDGDVEGFLQDEAAPVLLAVHHVRLSHVIANFGAADPALDPRSWLEQVEREPDVARRMRRRLVDDAVVHAADLGEAEADWLSRRVRGDDGGPLAKAFGLALERRLEGAAFVVPDDAFRFLHELGPIAFPAPGTVPHAALLLIEHAAAHGSTGPEGPGNGWCGLQAAEVVEQLSRWSASRADGRGGWKLELAQNPQLLAEEIRRLLMSLDLLRVQQRDGGSPVWWFSPATGRWTAPLPEGTK